MKMRRREPVTMVRAWQSRFGLVEEYEYPPGRAGTMPIHAHRELQICLSVDFPGRYLYRGQQHDVPPGAVSILDSWEPHAASDPCDRDRPSHYVVLYLDPVEFRCSIGLKNDIAIHRPVRIDGATSAAFRALYRALGSHASVLQQDERYAAFARRVFAREDRRPIDPAPMSLLRARDYIAAHALDRIGVRDVAAHAQLSPWHLVRAFRRRFGLPPHQFQLGMRIDTARRLLAAGLSGAEVAHRTGFADQSHFVRAFGRIVRTTPARYGSPARKSAGGKELHPAALF